MKYLKITSLILAACFLVILMSRLGFAQDDCKGCKWTAGENEISKLPLEKRQRLLGVKLPANYDSVFKAYPYKFIPPTPKGAITLPTRFDWRDSGYVTPVTNQQNCGSCWDFCAVAALEAMVKKYGEVELDLSEQAILSCISFGTGCSGGQPENAYNHFKSPYGAVREVCMPYQADDQIPCTEGSCQKWARISNYTTVNNNTDLIKTAILTHGPVSTLFAAPDTFSYYNGGCFNYAYYTSNHCMLLVGWDDTMCNGNGAWIVKNSWGTTWGINGYAFIKYNCCMIGTGVEYPNYIYHRPYVRFDSITVEDNPPGGNGNGRCEPGEAVHLDFTFKNVWSALNSVNLTITPDTAGITLDKSYFVVGNMTSKQTYRDSTNFHVVASFPVKRVHFNFHVTGDSGGGHTYTADTTVEVWVGLSKILLVDDDSGGTTYGNYEKYYTAAFDSLGLIYDVFDKQAKGNFTFSLSKYEIVVWYTGDNRTSIFSTTDIDSLISFLNRRGSLFLTSQDAVQALSGLPEPPFQQFLTDYLHVGYGSLGGGDLITGQPGDEVGESLLIRPWGQPGADNQTSRDELVPDPLADTVMVYADIEWTPTNFVAATRFANDTFKVVVFGFGFEAISSGNYSGKHLSGPPIVMRRVLDWLKPYVYGDANNDGVVDVGDVVYLINYLFKGGSAPVNLKAGDPNGSCLIDVGDVVYLINYLFKGGSAPVAGCAY